MKIADERGQLIVFAQSDDPVVLRLREHQPDVRKPEGIVGCSEAAYDYFRQRASFDDVSDVGRRLQDDTVAGGLSGCRRDGHAHGQN
jgi:hypothetical protein